MAKVRGSGSRGATIIEILIATSILASLLAIGIPRLQVLRQPYALRGAVRQVAADLQATRLRAIARNTSYRVTFNTTATTYTIERQLTDGTFVADSPAKPLAKGVTLGAVNPSNPVFNSRGQLAQNVTVPITVGARTRTVTINVLGRTTIS